MSSACDDVGLQARLNPERLALVDLTTSRRWTYAELNGSVGRCATVLTSLGLTEGHRLAAYARNRAELIIVHLACARLGLIYAPLNWRLADRELAGLIDDIEPSLLIHDDGNDRGCWAIGLDELAQRIETAPPLPEQAFHRDRPSLILYTSGTSGRPKGAMLSERNISESAINFSLVGRVGRESRFLCDSPLFHVIGLIVNVRPALMMGGAVLISDQFQAERTLARLSDPDLGATHYVCVPQMATMMRVCPEFDAATFRNLNLFIGGAPNPTSDVLQWLSEGITMVNGFGMSENGTVLGMPIDAEIIARKPSSAGIHTARTELKIADDNGEPVPDGHAGELMIRGPNVTIGYWRQPEATAAAFTEDGWFRTGDVAMRDEDGFYFILDRKKDMYVSGGENVYPAEVELALAELRLPGVKEFAVVGMPDERWGEVGHIALVLEDGRSDFGINEICNRLEGRVARYKMPKRLSVLPALPRTGSGKIMKSTLRSMLAEQ